MACEYVCPHDGGNEREANYFEKAVCAICHSEYGEYVKDTTAPTGKVEIRERTWWQELLNKITFDLFYKETVTLAITGEDDSGRDVAIRYTIENAAAEDAEALTYDEEYTGTVDLSDERQYVIYAYIEDWAGNRTYLSSDGFEIDKTAPVVEVIAPVSRTLDDGGAYVFCTQRLVFRAADKNLKDVTIGNDDALMTDGDGNYVIESAGEYEFVLTDQAGNESRVRVTLYAAHDFDQATGKCRHCKADAAAKVEKRELTAWFADGDELFKALTDEKFSSATADITAKELTIDGLKVKNKPYDGTNGTEIDGAPTLVGVVDGDTVQLLCGVLTFDRVTVGKGIGISFTKFALFGDDVTIGNYKLRQPAGITADIVAYLADGSEYVTGSHDWINTDFVITAKGGYLLSLTDAADGTWTDTLTASNETGDGELVFYVKNVATGAISAAVTENYKIDKTAPTGTVELIRRSALRRLVNKLTFGLFFDEDVRAVATTADEASGVKTVWWLKSDKTLTADELRAADG